MVKTYKQIFHAIKSRIHRIVDRFGHNNDVDIVNIEVNANNDDFYSSEDDVIGYVPRPTDVENSIDSNEYSVDSTEM